MAMTASLRLGRRAKIALAASLVLLLLPLVAAYLAVTLRYELTFLDVRTIPSADSRETFGASTQNTYLFRRGGTIEYGFTIANHGPLTVHLEDVINPSDYSYPWSVQPVRMDTDLDSDLDGSNAVRFQPLDLRPGGQVVVWTTLRLDISPEPEAECGPLEFAPQSVNFKVLGMSREQEVSLAHTIKIVFPDDGIPCDEYS